MKTTLVTKFCCRLLGLYALVAIATSIHAHAAPVVTEHGPYGEVGQAPNNTNAFVTGLHPVGIGDVLELPSTTRSIVSGRLKTEWGGAEGVLNDGLALNDGSAINYFENDSQLEFHLGDKIDMAQIDFFMYADWQRTSAWLDVHTSTDGGANWSLLHEIRQAESNDPPSVDRQYNVHSLTDPTGTLASGINAIRFTFLGDGMGANESGYVEIDVYHVEALEFANIFGFEAESGITPDGVGYRVQSNPEALGGQYIDTDRRDAKAPFGDQAVFRNYSLSLPAGTYDLWGRIYCPVFFSYDPEISDDPDSNDALFAYENDSFFVASTLGGDPAVDLDRGNGFASSGRFDGSGNPPRANVHDNWVWINLTDGTDLNGLGPNSGTVDPVASYTSAGGQVTFKLMSREGGIRHDAFAFVVDGELPTEEELDEAVEASKGTLRFTAISVDPETNEVSLTWASRSGISYILNWSRDLATDSWIEIDDNVTSQGETTTFVVPAGPAENPNPAEEPRLYFQVSEP